MLILLANTNAQATPMNPKKKAAFLSSSTSFLLGSVMLNKQSYKLLQLIEELVPFRKSLREILLIYNLILTILA